MLVLVLLSLGCGPALWEARTPRERAAQAKARKLYAVPEEQHAPHNPAAWWFAFAITLPDGTKPLKLQRYDHGLDDAVAAQIEAVLSERRDALLQCFGAPGRWAELEVEVTTDGTLEHRNRYGLSDTQTACVYAQLAQVLTSIQNAGEGWLSVRLEDPSAVGTLTKASIRQTITAHVDEVRFCYVEGLREKVDLRGRVTIKFIILPDGHVSSAAVAETTLHFEPVERCIARVVKTWQFERPRGGGIVVVTYPFLLN